MSEPDRVINAKLGDRVYPFTKVFHANTNPFLMRYRLDAGTWTEFTNPSNAFTDKLGQARLFSYIVAGFGIYVFELDITDVEDQIEDPEVVEVHVISRVIRGRTKHTVKDRIIAPFNDCIIGNGTFIESIKFSVSGAVTVGQTAINREVFYRGKHTGSSSSAVLVEESKLWNSLGIRLGIDIVRNVTDGSEGVADSISSNGAELSVTLTGGSGNSWDANDEYEIVNGDPLNLVANRFKYQPTVEGLHLMKLHVESVDSSVSVVTIPVQVADFIG